MKWCLLMYGFLETGKRNDDNKDDIFRFLAYESVFQVTEAKVIIGQSTLGDNVVCSKLEQNTEDYNHAHTRRRTLNNVFMFWMG